MTTEERIAHIDRNTFRSDTHKSASEISSKWEQDSRKDPEEEYFRLSCLALKIIYNEQDTDFVFTVSPGKLYAKCKKQKIPFHMWYIWIEKELQKVNEMQKRAIEAHSRPKSILERINDAIFKTKGAPTPRQGQR